MSLSPGTRLGTYQIVGLIGAGGMGEVYRGVDTRLNRQIAIKVLPAGYASDPERVARFDREARTLAGLDHPNIASIHGVEEAHGVTALVLELVEGPTLADRIAQGPIPIEEALPIVRQIAEALEAAHEKGIVHRDLKPANIKVRPDGTVKVLDFGLAKAFASDGSTAPAVIANSPTLTSPASMTGMGVLLGTAAYMSPEQARGGAVDRRTDLWAYGVVVYEMLAGKALFQGATITDTLAAIVATEPDWSALPKDIPAAVLRLLRRCLEKDRRRRLDSASDARLEIEDALSRPEPRLPSTVSVPSRWYRSPFMLFSGLVVVAVASALLTFGLWRRPTFTLRAPPVRLNAHLGVEAGLVVARGGVRRGAGSSLALSPDGRYLAFAAQEGNGPSRLYVRDLQELDAVALSGTDDAGGPFFSPDGVWIGFFAGGKLKKVQVTGGTVLALCDVPAARGGTWGDDGTIVYTPHPDPGAGLMRVPDAGGTPTSLTNPSEGESTHRWAQLLPGGTAVLYTASRSNTGPYDQANLVIQPLPSGSPSTIVEGGSYGRYVPTGHLVYVRAGTLFAAPFDLRRLKVTGRAVPVVQGITYAVDSGTAQFTLSASGTLAYLPATNLNTRTQLAWVERSGSTSLIREVPIWTELAFSRDGEKVAFAGRDTTGFRDIWIYEIGRDNLVPVTRNPEDDFAPSWSPTGRFITFTSARLGGIRNIFLQRADGTGQAIPLTKSARIQMGGAAWHPGGRQLAFGAADSGLLRLPVNEQDADARELATPDPLTEDRRDGNPNFSPDGKWIAYNSDDSGRQEVYVRPFPSLDFKVKVSTSGGERPRWAAGESGGQTLFYINPSDLTIMHVPVALDNGSLRARPQPWGKATVDGGTAWDVHPDGKRVLMRLAAPIQGINNHINLVFNALPN
jgi:serine/threonine-protein kinase